MLRGKGGTPSHPIAVPFARVDPPRGEGKGREGRRGGRGGFVDDLNARSGNVWGGGDEEGMASLEGAGNLLRYVERSLPSEYEERFLLLSSSIRLGWRFLS